MAMKRTGELELVETLELRLAFKTVRLIKCPTQKVANSKECALGEYQIHFNKYEQL